MLMIQMLVIKGLFVLARENRRRKYICRGFLFHLPFFLCILVGEHGRGLGVGEGWRKRRRLMVRVGIEVQILGNNKIHVFKAKLVLRRCGRK